MSVMDDIKNNLNKIDMEQKVTSSIDLSAQMAAHLVRDCFDDPNMPTRAIALVWAAAAMTEAWARSTGGTLAMSETERRHAVEEVFERLRELHIERDR